MASRGITGVQDACATDFIRQRLLSMQARGLLQMRITAATCFHEDDYSGKLDIEGHLAKATQVRSAFAGNPLIKADAVKIFLDGVLEGDPFTSPPFLPNAGMLENYHSPHLALDPDSGEVSITADSEDAGSNGIVNYKEADLTRYVTALDGAGFGIHMHSIGDRSTRVALDALEAARASNGESGIPHTLAHLQVVHPDDQKRLGELGLYLTFTYAWTTPQLAYDMLVSPFIQPTKAGQSLSEAIYDPMGYLHDALYPVERSRQAGAVLVAGSDAPVDSRDPRPFENMAAGIVKAAGSGDDFRASQRTSLAEMLAAYCSAARFLRLTPAMPMLALPNAEAVGPVASLGTQRGSVLRETLRCEKNERTVLIAFGGIDHDLRVDHWPETPGIRWLLPQTWNIARPDMTAFEPLGFSFTDLLASVDAVLTKPGYGTFVEAACNRTAVLYQRRKNWPEQDCLIEWLKENGRCHEIEASTLAGGHWRNAFEALWAQPAPPTPFPSGIAQAVALLRAGLRADNQSA